VTAAEAALAAGSFFVNMVGNGGGLWRLSGTRRLAHRSSGYHGLARAGRPTYGSSGDWGCLYERRATDDRGDLLDWYRLGFDSDHLFFDLGHWPVTCVRCGSSSGTDLLGWWGWWNIALFRHHFLSDGYGHCSRRSAALFHDVLVVMVVSVGRHECFKNL